MLMNKIVAFYRPNEPSPVVLMRKKEKNPVNWINFIDFPSLLLTKLNFPFMCE